MNDKSGLSLVDKGISILLLIVVNINLNHNKKTKINYKNKNIFLIVKYGIS